MAAFSLALLTLEACGRRGPLEPPPDPTVVQTPAASAANPDDPLKRNKVVPITPPTRALPIDSLL
jgi:predicted small lipoprotein YifL